MRCLLDLGRRGGRLDELAGCQGADCRMVVWLVGVGEMMFSPSSDILVSIDFSTAIPSLLNSNAC